MDDRFCHRFVSATLVNMDELKLSAGEVQTRGEVAKVFRDFAVELHTSYIDLS